MAEIPTADWSRINAAADRFERAWKAGPRPRIEDYLAEAEPGSAGCAARGAAPRRARLRRRDGEDPGPEEYSLRFSQHADLIRAVFGPGPDPARSRGSDPARRRPHPFRPTATPKPTATCRPAHASAISATTRSRPSSAAAAWASSTRPDRSA